MTVVSFIQGNFGRNDESYLMPRSRAIQPTCDIGQAVKQSPYLKHLPKREKRQKRVREGVLFTLRELVSIISLSSIPVLIVLITEKWLRVMRWLVVSHSFPPLFTFLTQNQNPYYY